MEQSIIITYTLKGVGTDSYKDYLAHALCLEGECRFLWNGETGIFRKGDVMIMRKGKLLEKIEPQRGFKVMVVYVLASFIELCTPQNNYGMKGSIALFLNPVMRLTDEQFAICKADFEAVAFRLAQTDNHFRRDILINVVQTMILDFFDFHSHLSGETDISLQNASVMSRFMVMLEAGDYRRHRDLAYYADRLCVSTKYLSEISKKSSGHAAKFWINRYTALDISRLLRDQSLSFVEIAELFGFSSPSYFTRYVRHNLGMSPTDYRD